MASDDYIMDGINWSATIRERDRVIAHLVRCMEQMAYRAHGFEYGSEKIDLGNQLRKRANATLRLCGLPPLTGPTRIEPEPDIADPDD